MSSNLLFNIRSKLKRKRKQAIPSLFDPGFYLDSCPEARTTPHPWQHYCQVGIREGLDPHPLFSTRHYQKQHLDNDLSVNPVEHYLKPENHSCDPHPLLDTECYLSQLEQSPEAGTSPLEHFLTHNVTNQASPSVFFDTRRYLEMYAEVQPTGMSALYHFARFGFKQTRHIAPDIDQLVSVIKRPNRPDYDWLIDHWQPEIRFLAAILRLDLSRSTVLLAATSAKNDFSTLIQKISVVYETIYDANVIHLFDRNSSDVAVYTSLGPSASIEFSAGNEWEQASSTFMVEIVKRLGAISAIYIDQTGSDILDHFGDLDCPKIAVFPKLPSSDAKKQLEHALSICDSVIVPGPTAKRVNSLNIDQSKTKIHFSEIDFKAINLAAPETTEATDAANPFRQALEIDVNSQLVVGCGNLDLASGFDRFLSTVLSYCTTHPEGTSLFLWVGPIPKGKDDHAAHLIEELKQFGADERVVFCGRRDLQAEALKAADVILFTHRRGSESLSLTDCLDAHKPIIWFKGNSRTQEIMNDDQFGVSPGNMTDAVQLLDQLASDPELSASTSSTNRKRREKSTSVSELVHEMSGIIESLRCDVVSDLTDDKNVISIVPFLKNTQRQRIIFSVPGWQISGVNTFIDTLVNELCELGFDAFVLFTRPQPLTENKSVLPNMPTRILSQDASLSPKRRKQLLTNYLKLMAPCVFMPNYDYVASAVTPELPDNVATLGVLHSDDPAHYVHGYRMGPYWDSIVSVSDHIHNKLMDMNPSFENRSSVIRYGIRDQKQVIEPRKPKANEKLKVVYTGRIVQNQKQIFDFVEVANQLAEHKDLFELIFVGDGPDFNEFQTMMEPHTRSGLVRLVGRVKPESINQYLLEGHVFALTSEFEGLPLSLLEAMSAGLVPVVTDIASGVGEILDHQKNALISPINDPKSMAANLLDLANDSDLFNRLSKESRQSFYSCQLTAKDMARQYAVILDQLFAKIADADEGRTQKLIYCPHIERMLNVA